MSHQKNNLKMLNLPNFLISLLFFAFILSIFCEEKKTILDYRSLYSPFKMTNETLKEVYLGFEDNSRVLAYVDFENTDEKKA